MGQTNFYARNYVGWPATPISQHNDPNSQYWIEQADMYQNWIDLAIGQEARLDWADALPVKPATEKEWAEVLKLKFREVNPPTQRK